MLCCSRGRQGFALEAAILFELVLLSFVAWVRPPCVPYCCTGGAMLYALGDVHSHNSPPQAWWNRRCCTK